MKSILLSAFVLCSFILNAQTDNSSSLKLSTPTPEAGKSIDYVYTGQYVSNPNFDPVLYYSVKDNVYALPLDGKASNQTYSGQFILPDSAQSFAFAFKTDKDYDKNNDTGYIFNVYKNAKPIPGSYASEVDFILPMAQLLGLNYDLSKGVSLYNQEFALHPEQKAIYWKKYYNFSLHNKSTKDAATKDLQQMWQDSLASGSEESCIDIYNYLTGYGDKDSAHLDKQFLAKYPSGKFATGVATKNLFTIKNPDSLVQTYNNYKKQYPNLDSSISVQQYYTVLSQKYMAKKDLTNFQLYTDKLSNNEEKVQLYNQVAWPIADKGNDDSVALGVTLAKKGVDAAEAMYNDKPTYFTQKDWNKFCQNNYSAIGDTYGLLLFRQGKIKEALAVQKKAVPDANTDPDEAGRLMQYLVADGQNKEAMKRGEDFIENGKITDKIKDNLKQAYIKEKGSDAGFDDYYAKHKDIGEEKALADVKKEMINKPSYQFSLKDVNGNQISLASLKGKVVVIDFWATWCGPCKRSFPGMQMAVNKYKDDPDVKFVFIDTWESQPTMDERIKEVNKLMSDNKYTFHVLLDNPTTADKSSYEVVSGYNVNGIPAKFILDKNGNIRFTAVGYDGSPEKLAKEVSDMIELARKG